MTSKMSSDPFLSDPTRKRKRPAHGSLPKKTPPLNADEEITSELEADHSAESAADDADSGSDAEFAGESAADKRRRLAKQYLENLKAEELGGAFNAEDLDEDILARRLKEDVAENKGFAYRFIAEALEKQRDSVRLVAARVGLKHLTAVAVRHPYAYTVAKDTELVKWNVERKPRRVKHLRGGAQYAALRKNPLRNHHCAQINAVAVSPDGRHVVTGGSDARLCIWLAESLVCVCVVETRAAVNALAFRRNSDQVYAACADLRIRTFSVAQRAQLETLYGHQDNIVDISALGRETCVSVGLRDKTAMYWKIAEELRLTFRAGDTRHEHHEGSLEACSMVDEMHFVTGSDNGNLSLWLRARKRPVYTERVAHGVAAPLAAAQATADAASLYVPRPQPHWITAVHAVPYSNVFVSGSHNGELKVWRIDEKMRSFALLATFEVRGCVVGIDSEEHKKTLSIYVASSKEHRLGRWLKTEGRNQLAVVSFAL